MNVQLIKYTPKPEELVASTAKLCYSSVGVSEIQKKLTEEEVQNFISHIVSIGHGSVLEHVSFTFGVEGVSRITEIQLVRSRVGCSYSIQSGRYINRNNPEFIVPPDIEKSKLALNRYREAMIESINAYNEIFLILMLKKMGYHEEQIELLDEDKRIKKVAALLETDRDTYKRLEKQCIENARYAHLQSLATKIAFTMTARALLNFFELRCCNRSQWEIRDLANKMKKLVKEVAPNIFKYAGASCLRGYCKEGKMSCGLMNKNNK